MFPQKQHFSEKSASVRRSAHRWAGLWGCFLFQHLSQIECVNLLTRISSSRQQNPKSSKKRIAIRKNLNQVSICLPKRFSKSGGIWVAAPPSKCVLRGFGTGFFRLQGPVGRSNSNFENSCDLSN